MGNERKFLIRKWKNEIQLYYYTMHIYMYRLYTYDSICVLKSFTIISGMEL